MKISIAIAAIIGLSLLIALIVYHGFDDIVAVLSSAGWGLMAVAAFHIIPMTCSAWGWLALRGKHRSSNVWIYIGVRWIREAVNGLLPVAQIGGPVVGTRVLALRGVPTHEAGAGVITDVGTEVLTQALFTLVGIGFLLMGDHYSGNMGWILGGSLYLIVSAIGFVFATRIGLFKLLENFLDKLATRFPLLSMGDVNGLHDAIVRIHKDHRAVGWSAFWHLLSWFTGVGEVWLALHFLGHPVGWQEALVLESLGQAVRGAAFMIPGGLGVQEGGYLLLGSLYGLPPEVSLALSLTKRVRELVLGLPALAAWQGMELRRLLRARRRGSDA